jgi:hypothetical protein
MKFEQVLKHYDGNMQFAAYNLGFTDAALRKWKAKGAIPHRTQVLIESITAGKLKADKKVKK